MVEETLYTFSYTPSPQLSGQQSPKASSRIIYNQANRQIFNGQDHPPLFRQKSSHEIVESQGNFNQKPNTNQPIYTTNAIKYQTGQPNSQTR